MILNASLNAYTEYILMSRVHGSGNNERLCHDGLMFLFLNYVNSNKLFERVFHFLAMKNFSTVHLH